MGTTQELSRLRLKQTHTQLYKHTAHPSSTPLSSTDGYIHRQLNALS